MVGSLFVPKTGRGEQEMERPRRKQFPKCWFLTGRTAPRKTLKHPQSVVAANKTRLISVNPPGRLQGTSTVGMLLISMHKGIFTHPFKEEGGGDEGCRFRMHHGTLRFKGHATPSWPLTSWTGPHPPSPPGSEHTKASRCPKNAPPHPSAPAPLSLEPNVGNTVSSRSIVP